MGLLEDHHLHLLSIQLLHQSRTTTPTLGRLMLGATARTKTPTATRWRRSSSRTSVSLTRRKLAGHKTRICSPAMYKNCTGVIDTTYDIDTTTKDDYQCCNVETPNCYMEEKTINDVTCTNTV